MVDSEAYPGERGQSSTTPLFLSLCLLNVGIDAVVAWETRVSKGNEEN